MGTYEIHKNFGVCNKSEDENNFMKNERRNFNVYLGIYLNLGSSIVIFEKLLFFSRQTIKIWACQFSWFAALVQLVCASCGLKSFS
jgi:hypothetical protein